MVSPAEHQSYQLAVMVALSSVVETLLCPLLLPWVVWTIAAVMGWVAAADTMFAHSTEGCLARAEPAAAHGINSRHCAWLSGKGLEYVLAPASYHNHVERSVPHQRRLIAGVASSSTAKLSRCAWHHTAPPTTSHLPLMHDTIRHDPASAAPCQLSMPVLANECQSKCQ